MIWRWVLASEIPIQVRWQMFWLGVLFAILTFAPVYLSEYGLISLTEILILCLFAASFNLLMGTGGMISFGQSAYFGIGGYTVALLTLKTKLPLILIFCLGPLVSAGGALLVGILAVRLTTVYFSMLTLAFSQIVYYVVARWYSLTNGDQGLQGVRRFELAESTSRFFYFVALTVSLACFLIYRITKSPFGLTLMASRDNRKRIPFIGLNLITIQLTTFAIAGLFSGLAGALFAMQNLSVDTEMLSFQKSLDPLLASLIGGVYSFYGPLLGAVTYKLLEVYSASNFPMYWPMVIGLCLLTTSIYWPRGLVGMLQDPRWIKWIWKMVLRLTQIQTDLMWFVRRKWSKYGR